MSAKSAPEIVVVEVPVTLRVEVIFPEGPPRDSLQSAHFLAVCAAKSLTHVSAAQIHAFNEVNRLHPFGTGEVLAVDSIVHAAAPESAA